MKKRGKGYIGEEDEWAGKCTRRTNDRGRVIADQVVGIYVCVERDSSAREDSTVVGEDRRESSRSP